METNRSKYYASLCALTGIEPLLVRSDRVIGWMHAPESHAPEVTQFFTTPSDERVLFDFQQFLRVCRARGESTLQRVLAGLPPELCLIGSFHDDRAIGDACAASLGATFPAIVARLERPKLSSEDVQAVLRFGAAPSARLALALPAALTDLHLHDVDRNGLSSHAVRFANITLARVLYLVASHPEWWPPLATLLQPDSLEGAEAAWRDVFYEKPAFTKMSWHIQSTVLRVTLLSAMVLGRDTALDVWTAFAKARGSGLGHHGSAGGYNNESVKLVVKLRPLWRASHAPD